LNWFWNLENIISFRSCQVQFFDCLHLETELCYRSKNIFKKCLNNPKDSPNLCKHAHNVIALSLMFYFLLTQLNNPIQLECITLWNISWCVIKVIKCPWISIRLDLNIIIRGYYSIQSDIACNFIEQI
jgi:hypothetical protein